MKCICHICECGQHRCPVHDVSPRPTKFEGVTEAQAEYVRKQAARAQRVKHVDRKLESGQFYGETEANAAFKEYKVVPPAQREPEKWKPSGLKFHGTSENHAQFTDKEAQRAVVTRAADNLRVRGSCCCGCDGVLVCV